MKQDNSVVQLNGANPANLVPGAVPTPPPAPVVQQPQQVQADANQPLANIPSAVPAKPKPPVGLFEGIKLSFTIGYELFLLALQTSGIAVSVWALCTLFRGLKGGLFAKILGPELMNLGMTVAAQVLPAAWAPYGLWFLFAVPVTIYGVNLIHAFFNQQILNNNPNERFIDSLITKGANVLSYTLPVAGCVYSMYFGLSPVWWTLGATAIGLCPLWYIAGDLTRIWEPLSELCSSGWQRSKPALKGLQQSAITAQDYLQPKVQPALDYIRPKVQPLVDKVKPVLQHVAQAVMAPVKPLLQLVWNKLPNVPVDNNGVAPQNTQPPSSSQGLPELPPAPALIAPMLQNAKDTAVSLKDAAVASAPPALPAIVLENPVSKPGS